MFIRVIDDSSLKELGRKAMSIIAPPVKKTLGPGGNLIIIEQTGQNPDGSEVGPLITKDGVTVAEHVKVRDPALNTLIKAIMQVAQKTVKDGGDGTTTSVVLAEALYNAGAKYAEQGANGIELFNALQQVKDEVISVLDNLKEEVKDEDIINVARISSNGDEEIAQIIFKAITASGEDGYVAVEDGYSRETTLEIVEGAMYRRGWRDFAPNGSLLVTDKARNVCELSKAAVLIYADKLDSLADFQTFLNKTWQLDEQQNVFRNIVPVMIVAHDFSDEIKNKILQIKVNNLPIAAIKSPADGSPNARTEMLEDLAAMLGGTVSSRGILELKDVNDEHLGYANRIEIGPNETVFYEGGGDKEAIKSRIQELNTLLDTANLHEWDQDNIRLRKAKLSQGVAIIKAGGKSELEMREKKDRIEDALCAAKVAVQDGILPGGGITLYRIAQHMENEKTLTGIAYQIMIEALKSPIRQIIANSGKNPDIVLTKMPEGKGYDARRHVYVDMMQSGIVDPAKVTKSALENAVSIAGLLLTSGGALVSDIVPEDGKANPFAGLMG